uniref:Large ribosomal subunit protein bL21c n=1 Tax=Scoliosorus ensiformis TaxID=38541 RepID=A0A3G5CUN4_9MONI|nr:ribosomal protein L21 [Scoliosorus ensiformis]AYW16554.1 ribosomal protein L21 [Scoliosorus ensiformis]
MNKYAIIDIEGKQLRVEPGRFYDIRRFNDNLNLWGINTKFSIYRVLLFRDESNIHVGSPWVVNAVIKGRIFHSCFREKLTISKISCKKKTLRICGYKENMIRLTIDSIGFHCRNVSSR